MYKIVIEDLQFDTIIGILEFERNTPQRVIIDLEIQYNKKDEFIDYAKVVEFIKEEMKKNKFLLIEDAIDFFIIELKNRYSQIESLKISIKKRDILKDCIVGVESLKKY